MGSAAGGGTAHGVTQSHYSNNTQKLQKKVGELMELNSAKDGELKTLGDQLNAEKVKTHNLTNKVTQFNNEANHWHLMAQAADAKDQKRRKEWCRWYAPNGAAYAYEYSGTLGGKPMKFRHIELGCFKDGSY